VIPMPRPIGSRAGWLAGLVAVLWLLPATAAPAHPLGLPAFARVAATGPDTVTVVWNVPPDDAAVLARSLGFGPGDRELLSEQQDGEVSASPELVAHLRDGIVVRQAGHACASRVEVMSLVREGATLEFSCPEEVGEVEVEVDLLSHLDARYRTMVVAGTSAGPQRTILSGAAPAETFVLDRGGAEEVLVSHAAAQTEQEGSPAAFGGSLPFEGRFVALIDRTPTMPAALLGLVLAFGVGIAHGAAPGHGKSIAAAYLVGDRGRPRDAVLLGASVAAMHTGSVLALGFALYGIAQQPAVASLSAWLQLVSGLVVVGVGGWLLLRRWRERHGGGRGHGHAHGHVHPHGHGHAHVHVPAHAPGDGVEAGAHPLSWQGLVTLGAAGGMLPSPSALLVLFTALALERLAHGLALIGAFSLGLATTVAGVGLTVLWGRDRLGARLEVGPGAALLRHLPVGAASIVVILGTAVVLRSVGALS
jgi:ABC-type nickel/cobalt efflux system permease component RcnA